MKRRVLQSAVVAGILGLAVCALVYVPNGRLGVLEAPGGSLRVLSRPGLHLRHPWFAALSLYPAGAIPLEGRVQVSSREGAAVELHYALSPRLMEGGLEPIHRRSAGRTPEEFLRQTVDEVARAYAAGQPLPALLVPGAWRPLRRALEAALESRGVWLGADSRLDWEPPEPPGAEAARAALRARVQDTGLNVLLVGLDGADWDWIDPLIERGRLPTLARLKQEGAWGRLRSDHPMLSPLLWTTIATGRSPDQHGVMDFLMRDPETGRMVPISASFRRVKALWNILTDYGVGSDFVAWWATWPAERIDGTLVSDRLSYSLFPLADAQTVPEATTWPEAYLEEIRPRLITDRDITYADIRRFVEISEAEFRQIRSRIEAEPRAAYQDPVNHLTRILAATRNYHAIALDLLEHGPRRLTAVYYQAIDEVNHRFAHFAPPRMDRISAEEFRRYSGTVERIYEYQDELLGELLEKAGERAVVIALSDHGFANGAARPRDFTPSIEGRPARWHTLYGIRILKGPVVKRGALEEGKLVDVAPTVLRLLGVPLSRELEGKVWEEALDASFLRRHPTQAVDTYEQAGRPLMTASGGGPGAGGAELVESLRSLGYIGEAQAAEALSAPTGGAGGPVARREEPGRTAGAAPVGAVASYHSNLASILLGKGDLDGAEREFRSALSKEPKFGPAFGGLAEIAQRRGRHDESLRLILQGIEQGPDPDDALFIAATRAYLKLKREGEGAERFAAMVDRLPLRAAPRICRGILLLRAGRGEEAERVLREALEVDPASLSALQELFDLYEEQHRLPELERALQAALERNPRSVVLRNWLAWVRSARGDAAGAETYFRAALRDDPENLETLSNLGSLLIDLNRSAEAVEVLGRAVAREPRHWQSRVNLIIALGKASRLDEARQVFEGAEPNEREKTKMLNALAYACYLNGDEQRALENVQRSLTIDPDQPEARRLLDTLGGG